MASLTEIIEEMYQEQTASFRLSEDDANLTDELSPQRKRVYSTLLWRVLHSRTLDAKMQREWFVLYLRCERYGDVSINTIEKLLSQLDWRDLLEIAQKVCPTLNLSDIKAPLPRFLWQILPLSHAWRWYLENVDDEERCYSRSPYPQFVDYALLSRKLTYRELQIFFVTEEDLLSFCQTEHEIWLKRYPMILFARRFPVSVYQKIHLSHFIDCSNEILTRGNPAEWFAQWPALFQNRPEVLSFFEIQLLRLAENFIFSSFWRSRILASGAYRSKDAAILFGNHTIPKKCIRDLRKHEQKALTRCLRGFLRKLSLWS